MLKNRQAFTLIEVIVVISLMGVMLFFAAPRMDGFLQQDESREVSKWILLNIADLKNKSAQEQKTFILNIDLDGNRFQIIDASAGPSEEAMAAEGAMADGFVDETMDGEFSGENAGKSFELPQGYQLNQVLFSDDRRVSNGVAAVVFYPRGYSDRVIIHITDRQNRRTSYAIEAFLPHVKIHDDHIQF